MKTACVSLFALFILAYAGNLSASVTVSPVLSVAPVAADVGCEEGMEVSADGKTCVDKNECLDNPCVNGGVCSNREIPYYFYCQCPVGFWGKACELLQTK